MLTLLTPTGARPEAFAICQRLMRRQSYRGPVRWVIVDDGPYPSRLEPVRKGWERVVLRPEPYWKEGENTQGRNLLAGLDYIEEADPDPWIVIIEDDDYYSPTWLTKIAAQLNHAELVGEGWAIYHNVATRRYERMNNQDHCSLRSSALRGDAIQTFREVMAKPCKYYDLLLWRKHHDKHIFNSRLTVGIKGLPGREGIAPGHVGVKGRFDPYGDDLRDLIGKDAELYSRFYMENTMDNVRYIVRKKRFYYNKKWHEVGDEVHFVKPIDARLHIEAKKVRRVVDEAPAAKPAAKPAPKKAATKNKPPAKSKAGGKGSSKPDPSPKAEAPALVDEKKDETPKKD